MAASRRRADAALASGLELPVSAVQRSPFPRLQHFAAAGRLAKGGKTMDAYVLRFGLQLGLTAGRELRVELAPAMPGRALAAVLRKVADQVDAWTDDCEAEAAKLSTDDARPARDA